MKTKIVLDADVIIHFAKGNLLSILPTIFTTYDYILLDTVYKEIKPPIKSQLDNQIHFIGNIKIIAFKPTGIELKEYAQLIQSKGKGESACLAFCRFNHNVIGSSNLKDIALYCKEFGITYVTTLDFLYFAIQKRIITEKEANQFIQDVRMNDSKLPDITMDSFISSVQL